MTRSDRRMLYALGSGAFLVLLAVFAPGVLGGTIAVLVFVLYAVLVGLVSMAVLIGLGHLVFLAARELR